MSRMHEIFGGTHFACPSVAVRPETLGQRPANLSKRYDWAADNGLRGGSM